MSAQAVQADSQPRWPGALALAAGILAVAMPVASSFTLIMMMNLGIPRVPDLLALMLAVVAVVLGALAWMLRRGASLGAAGLALGLSYLVPLLVGKIASAALFGVPLF